MAIYTKLTKSQIKRLLLHFKGIPNQGFTHSGVEMGTVNTYYKITFPDQKTFYLKLDEVGDLGRLRHEIEIFLHLQHHRRRLSFCVPAPLLTNTEKYYIPFKNKFALLFAEIPGTSKFSGLTAEHLKEIGRKIAELHAFPVPQKIRTHRFDLFGLKRTFQAIQPKLTQSHPQLSTPIRQKLKLLEEEKPKLKKVLIHGDLFPENVHWQGNRFSGMLDFEAAGLGEALFDICVIIHSFCHLRKKFNSKLIRAFLVGYQEVRSLTKKEKKYFSYFMQFTCMRFLITRLKDFELAGVSPRAIHFKDYREYFWRFEELNQLNTERSSLL